MRTKTILVGVCGGIAAYKVCALVSKLVQSGADVHVMMTKSATEFVAPLSFESLSHNRVTVDMFDRNFTFEVEHVSLAKRADAVIIAPATANVIAKLACGIADDFLTTTVLACKCPILFAPAMNTAMMENPVTVENINKLSARGFVPVYGSSGYLACGDVGSGRMAEPTELYDALDGVFAVKRDLEGKTVLITSGATRTNIDPVRFISNRSSGKMGYALAAAASKRGAKVIYIHGYTNDFAIPPDWVAESVGTTSELLSAVKKHYKSADISVLAAAPCDYDISPMSQKIKSRSLVLELNKAVDVAAWLGEHKKGKMVIFSAETENGEDNAYKKLKSKNADLAVLNDVTQEKAGFDVDTNIVTLITAESKECLPLMTKREVADIVLDRIIAL
ncbi:MAG: bifunctional phosphopantothenoylcysteine decarboxylase/phosphopantothenate--cysteine ligase CoaBC [Clostridiales bacterium]|nr:bifunctional phosphopantothenoylcysteine decarboxylase/phosphopantothenate--cysteine ligase CoaBC [Clostridiales bacterium]